MLDGSAEQEYALAAGIHADHIVTVDSQGALVREVANGGAQVGALTRIALLDEVRRNAGIGLEVTAAFAPRSRDARSSGPGRSPSVPPTAPSARSSTAG